MWSVSKISCWSISHKMDPMREKCLRGLRTTKAQSGQRPCYLLNGKYYSWTFYKRNFIFLASICSWAGWFESHFLGQPEDRFCRNEAQISLPCLIRTLTILLVLTLWLYFERSNQPERNRKYVWASACDFQQCGILTCVDSDEPGQPPFKLRSSKWCLVSSLTLIEYPSDLQRLWSDCAYAQAGLSLCCSHIPHSWKYHALAHIFNVRSHINVIGLIWAAKGQRK